MTASLPAVDYANHPAYGLMFEPDPELGARAERELRALIEAAAEVQRRRTLALEGRGSDDDALGREVAASSVARLQMEGPAFEDVAERTAPIVDMVRARIAEARAAGLPISFKLAQELMSRAEQPALWTSIDRLLREAGLIETTRRYFGAGGAKLKAAAVMVNTPGQSWTTGIFRDAGVETPLTAGMHIDSDGRCVLKTILYLSDVGADQGPFSLVPGSHAWEEDSPGRIHRRAFDKSGLTSRAADARRAFVSLPPELQVKAEFGGDVLAGSAQSRALLAQEQRMTGPRGQLCLFDPEAIHRGGQVASGERVVLLASLAAWEPELGA